MTYVSLEQIRFLIICGLIYLPDTFFILWSPLSLVIGSLVLLLVWKLLLNDSFFSLLPYFIKIIKVILDSSIPERLCPRLSVFRLDFLALLYFSVAVPYISVIWVHFSFDPLYSSDFNVILFTSVGTPVILSGTL